MQLKHTLAMVTMVVAATAAQATTTDWATHGIIEVGVGSVTTGPISDSFTFTLANAGNLYASAVANNLNHTFDITDGTVSLVRLAGDGGTEQVIDTFSFNGTSGSTTNSFGVQDAGSYAYRITGMAVGSVGGVYTITSETAPVPEPNTLVLMVAGLSALALLQRRRGHKR